MSRVAAIDCGTNSIRLLVADRVDGDLVDVHREMRIVRLGQGVDRTGEIAPEALGRTGAALRDYAATIEASGAEQIRMVATSATRDASNRSVFIELVRSALGIDPEVISGDEEAALSFAGAASVLGDTSGPLLVADVGGGSTELVRGDGGPLCSHSMDVGCVRMTERHLRDDPPTDVQVAAATADVRAALVVAAAAVPLDAAATFVGVAGTVTTLTAIVLGLKSYDSAAVHGATVSADQIREVTARLLVMTRDERAALPVLHPGRVDVIAGGAIVLRTIVDQLGITEMVASEHDILDGIALSVR